LAFARSSLILANNFLPLSAALCVKGCSVKYLYISVLLFSANMHAKEACPYTNDDKPSLLYENLSIVNLPFSALEYFNSGQPEEAKKLLINELSSSIIAIDMLLSHKECLYPKHEVGRAIKLLKGLALMNENYPIAGWEDNPEIQSVLQKYISYESIPESMVQFTHNKSLKQDK
jgi:hypothetical protein